MSPAKDPPRPPLTDEERRMLTEPAYFAERAAKGPVVLADRTVDNMEIRGQFFGSVKWTGVDFLSVTLAETTFVSAELAELTFIGCKLEDVAFAGARLSQCSFEICELSGVRLADCTADKLVLAGCVCRDVAFERCVLEGATWLANNLVGAALSDVRWIACELSGTKFDKAHVEDTVFEGSSFTDVVFSDSQGRGLLVKGGMVDGLDFMLGNWVGVTFDQIRGRCLRMNNVTNTGLSLLACGELVGVVMAGGSVEGMAIDRCPTLGLVSFLEAHIHDLAVSDSYIDGASWQRCRICDGCIIERATIVGLNVRQSTLDGVAIRDTELAADLVLEGARIDGLVLEGVRYAQDLVVRSEGATYGTGARFADRPTSH